MFRLVGKSYQLFECFFIVRAFQDLGEISVYQDVSYIHHTRIFLKIWLFQKDIGIWCRFHKKKKQLLAFKTLKSISLKYKLLFLLPWHLPRSLWISATTLEVFATVTMAGESVLCFSSTPCLSHNILSSSTICWWRVETWEGGGTMFKDNTFF